MTRLEGDRRSSSSELSSSSWVCGSAAAFVGEGVFDGFGRATALGRPRFFGVEGEGSCCGSSFSTSIGCPSAAATLAAGDFPRRVRFGRELSADTWGSLAVCTYTFVRMLDCIKCMKLIRTFFGGRPRFFGSWAGGSGCGSGGSCIYSGSTTYPWRFASTRTSSAEQHAPSSPSFYFSEEERVQQPGHLEPWTVVCGPESLAKEASKLSRHLLEH